jgi:hypothetical protein
VALPTVQDLKDYLRVQTAAEDALLAQLLTRATAMVETALGLPIASGRSFGGGAARASAYPIIGSLRGGGVTIGTVSERTITALADHPDYATRLESLASSAIIDVAADLYTHRDPDVTSESEAGASRAFGANGLPPRAERTIQMLRVEIG